MMEIQDCFLYIKNKFNRIQPYLGLSKFYYISSKHSTYQTIKLNLFLTQQQDHMSTSERTKCFPGVLPSLTFFWALTPSGMGCQTNE